jgi:hypothetical protein
LRFARFGVLTAAFFKIKFFWDVMTFRLVNSYTRCGGKYDSTLKISDIKPLGDYLPVVKMHHTRGVGTSVEGFFGNDKRTEIFRSDAQTLNVRIIFAAVFSLKISQCIRYSSSRLYSWCHFIWPKSAVSVVLRPVFNYFFPL